MPRKKPPIELVPAHGDPVIPGVNPAVAQHLTPEESVAFPIVAAGASAGGLDALNEFLKALAPDTGMAFVLIQHLAPTHTSLLAEILGRSTAMPVVEVTHNLEVLPNHVYVIPPGMSMALGEGRLQLVPRNEVRGQARPIDHFMRSLAEEHGHKAIGIVFSGTGNDGTVGLQEIKAAGGISFAQDATAEQGSMPRSAVASGAVDFVLPPDEIAREIARIASHPYVSREAESRPAAHESSLGDVIEVLRRHSGVDFANYKRNTLYRRITRRMVLHKLDSLQEYARFVAENAPETEALYQDVLINVTSFFRNPEAYEALKAQVFPKLVEGRDRQESIRVWALGCSTGEEAYSIAMAFSEYLEETGRRLSMQVFATDLNGAGIEKARSGVYARGISQDVSPERLRRFFVEVDGSYRISKPIRDMCVFARQNVLADPPFSRIDLVACRNMLIYLEPALQQRVIPMLHFALRSGGFLWLGGSETIGTYRDLFELLEPHHKIYLKKLTGRQIVVAPPRNVWQPRPLAAAGPPPAELRAGFDPHREADRVMLARYAPPAVVVNADLEILQFRGDASPYLAPAPGRASLNLLKMLREGLLVAVRAAVTRAARDDLPAREEGLRVKANGAWRDVDVVVLPLKGPAVDQGSLLVLFEEPAHSVDARMRKSDAEARDEAAALAKLAPPTRTESAEKEIGRLTQELGATREYLQSVIEQQEAANEELQSANEEVQSANEELQSINEELETSKEELQSSNEELATVNDELQNRNFELAQSNNDLTNLLASVQMAIVMLGRDLRIRRFTPMAEKLLNLIPGDIGRPLADIKLDLGGADLNAIIAEVIDSVMPRQLEVQDRDGHWFQLRVRPYRTLENRIEGAVVIFVDIDSLRQAEQSARESEGRFEVLANTAPTLIWLSDLEGLRFVNRAYEDFVGASEAEIRRGDPARYAHPDDGGAYLATYNDALANRKPFEARVRFRRADGVYRWMKAIGNPRLQPDGKLLGYIGCAFDITDMKEAESALVELDRGKNEFLAILAHELRNPLAGIRNAARLLTEKPDAGVLGTAREIIERQTHHMVRMIDDLLDVSRITYGKVQLRPEPLDLCEVVRRSVDATSYDRKKNEQSLSVSIPDTPIWVQGDAMRLDQVFSNLLNNASKFTPRGGHIWVSTEKGFKTRPSGPELTVAVRVRDDGAGIAAEFLPHVFDLFAQGIGFIERARTGMGLGLTLAKRLVELHGGTIEALSEGRDHGAEIIVRLPEIPARDLPKARHPRPKAGEPTVEGRRVLIVDDNRDSAESLKLMLTLAGHEARMVHDGASARMAAAAFLPDAILLDIGLPDMDGFSVARALRAEPALRDTLLIAITGFGRDEDVRRSRDSGIDVHVTKPIDPDHILELVGRGRTRP
jgi:two-component system CheB/CheR fusion protein